MDEMIKSEAVAVCQNLNSLTDMNPFKTCIENNKEEAYMEFVDCTYDYCVTMNNFENAREMVCGHLENFAKTCARLEDSPIVDWRTSYCPSECGENAHYDENACPIQKTCENPNDISECTLPTVPVCVCDDNFILSGAQCVRVSECGCSVGPNYYPNTYVKLAAVSGNNVQLLLVAM
ncbi:hypothetical protein KUTeg_013950 [Tegillarca granosa]|uniref:VWF/SSPO/Zonadhesin-like cysteine-rich domain-containing protein n=1 Tax=Tegillarca granosa TaxID=220873 RepID=A0ABQ9EXN2_TEGGR|nr:hypothetical protein KUTeg_013950 [Tegillarca granosa]